MRIVYLLPFVLPAVLAVPAGEGQTLLGDLVGYSDVANSLFGEIAKGVKHFIHGAEQVVEKKIEQWFDDGKEFVKQNGIVCEFA
jgi:hypothetical protein